MTPDEAEANQQRAITLEQERLTGMPRWNLTPAHTEAERIEQVREQAQHILDALTE
jgi:predicted metallo-beta-lactamase superfamily hydrolase